MRSAPSTHRYDAVSRQHLSCLPTNLDHQRQPGSLAAPASGESAGDCRIMYEIEDDRLLILVLRVGHRREIYRAL